MDVLYGGLGICKLQFCDKKNIEFFFQAVNLIFVFDYQNPGSRSGSRINESESESLVPTTRFLAN
jgi:hypothetical protein